jgi:hypothetical protein
VFDRDSASAPERHARGDEVARLVGRIIEQLNDERAVVFDRCGSVDEPLRDIRFVEERQLNRD